ncbi:MAG: exonuclease domain-containing protein [Actinomycetota bacterium]
MTSEITHSNVTTDELPFSCVVVDLETTGLDPATCRVIQMAALVVEPNGHVSRTFSTVVRPENPSEYEHGAEHIHGISANDVSHGMSLSEAFNHLLSLLPLGVFAGHNASFDLGFLHAEAARLGLTFPVVQHIDTLAVSRRSDPEKLRSHRLSELCVHHNIVLDGAHTALGDATATARLLSALLREADISSVDQLPLVLSEYRAKTA